MNFVTRIFWLVLNICFGTLLAYVHFFWIACDMKVPNLLKDFVESHISVLSPLFDAPYMKIDYVSSSLLGKVLFNAFLYLIFGFVHTVFAQESVQQFLARYLFPKETLRTVYCIIVSITVFILIGLWQHTNIELWNCLPSTMDNYQRQTTLMIAFAIVNSPGWYVIIVFNPLEFTGLTQLFTGLTTSASSKSSKDRSEQRTTGNPTLITSGLFRLCRHPLYLFTLLSFIIAPVMSFDRLLIFIYACLYLAIGIPLEERKLVNIFGQAYLDYQKRVPAVIPFTTSKVKKSE